MYPKFLVDFTIGDGYIKKESNSSYEFRLHHGIKQIEYLNHKEQRLSNYGVHICKFSDKCELKGNIYYSIGISMHGDLVHTAYKWTYNKGRKNIDNRLLRTLDAESLAYWFMDDGSALKINKCKSDEKLYVYNESVTNSYILNTQSFTEIEVKLVSDWLKEKFGIDSTIRNNFGKIIAISKIESKDRLVNIIEPYVIPSMIYKINSKHSFKGIPYTVVDLLQLKRLNEETPTDLSEEDATVQDRVESA